MALIILHCLTINRHDFHRDELNFIEDGRHLAWGYVDCPPLIMGVWQVLVGKAK